MLTLSIIIVTSNHRKYIGDCLSSLQKGAEGVEHEVLVVDNCSSDGTSEFVRINFPYVKLFEREKKAGFASNNNFGAKRASGKYLFFLNPDTILPPSSIKVLIDFMEKNPKCGACGPRLFNPDGTPQENARRFPHPFALFLRGLRIYKLFKDTKIYKHYIMEDKKAHDIFEVDWLLGAALLVRREVFEEVGLFDEKYPLYYEDVDLCMRIKKRGYNIYCISSVKMVHHYLRESAKLLNRRTLFHIIGILRFFAKSVCRLH